MGRWKENSTYEFSKILACAWTSCEYTVSSIFFVHFVCAAFQWHPLGLFLAPPPVHCVLARFGVHCCVSKLYWHSPRLLLLPHHLCCPPSLPVLLSPDWLTQIFNLSVYLSLLCLKQQWYRLKARRRVGRERWRWSWARQSTEGEKDGGGGGVVLPSLDGSKRTARGCKERKEMQKERTGLFVCFGF